MEMDLLNLNYQSFVVFVFRMSFAKKCNEIECHLQKSIMKIKTTDILKILF